MAYVSSTCNGHKALLTALKTFLDAASYVADRYTANDEYLFSKVFSGSDKWYGGIKIYDDGTNNVRAWKMRGNTGYNSSADFDSQVGTVSGIQVPVLSMDENTGNPNLITYWFVANSRRVAGCARIGSSYHHFYIGLYIPYANPAQLPYPIIVGGNTYMLSGGTIDRYNTTTNIYNYWKPNLSSSITQAPLILRTAAGNWNRINNFNSNSSPNIANAKGVGVYPYVNFYGSDEGYFTTGVENFTGNMCYMKPTPNGCYNLLPVIIYDNNPSAIYGELDGLYFVSGFNMVTESIITIGADNYIVLPNKSNSGDGEFIALKQA